MRRPFNGSYTVTQTWGVNPETYARFGLKGHNGIDYGTPNGTPIVAPHDGIVIEAAFDASGYGMYVKIENDKEGSILAHLHSFNVNPGDKILEGQQIGISNNTGFSTGPHLHWGYYRKPRTRDDGYSGTTNPWPYLSENIQNPPKEEPKTEVQQLKEEITKLNGAIEKKDERIKELEKTITTIQRETDDKVSKAVAQCQVDYKKKVLDTINKL